MIRRYPDAGVGYGELHKILMTAQLDLDASTGRRVFDGVRDEVGHHPANLGAVGLDHAAFMGYGGLHGELLIFGRDFELLGDVHDHGSQV